MPELRPDQLGRLAHTFSAPKTLDLSDPGTGKTPPAVVNQWKRASEDRLKTVWVMPKHLMPKNVKEILRFTPFTEKDVGILDGTAAQMDKVMSRQPSILLMGPDRFKKAAPNLPREYGGLDVDEFHMCFGGASGKMINGVEGPSDRVQAFYDYQRRVKQSLFMTGTLINGRLDTAFPAIHAIEPRYYPFGYEQFKGSHGMCDEYGRVIRWTGHERLSEIFGRHAIRVTFEQIFGKQPVVFETEWVQMHPTQRKMYDQFHDDAYLELENFMINGTQPGPATIRARQLMEHPNQFPDLRDPVNLPRVDIMPGVRPTKLDALEVHFDHHKRTGTPVVVFATMKPQMERIAALAEDCGLRVAPIMYSDTSAKGRDRADEGFRAGIFDIIVGSPPVCAVGYNWQFWGPHQQEVDHCIFSSLTYMDTDFSQGFRRFIRQKRRKPLRVTTQAYFDSVDLKIMNIVIRKSRDANKVDPTQAIITFNSHEREHEYV